MLFQLRRLYILIVRIEDCKWPGFSVLLAFMHDDSDLPKLGDLSVWFLFAKTSPSFGRLLKWMFETDLFER